MGKNSKQKREVKIKAENKKKRIVSATTNRAMYEMPDIFFDESGNTGSNLLDMDQPFFTLGSCKISHSDALKALELTDSKSPNEAHFKTLKRRKSGQDGIIRLLKSKYINDESVKVFLADKKYMLTAKIVDVLIESWSHNRGIDIYIDGQNLALSNVFYFCLPVFCGKENTDIMYDNFIKMIKLKSEESIEAFYSSVEKLKETCSEMQFIEMIEKINVTKVDVNEILKEVDKSVLDPSIPALFNHCIEWDKKFPSGYYIKHDDAKAIKDKTEIFNKFMDLSKITEIYGYDRRTFSLPIKARSLSFHSSEEYPQLQVADIVSGAAAYYVNCLRKQDLDDYFYNELKKTSIEKYFKKMIIWPTEYVSPKDLGTIYTGGVNVPSAVAKFLNTD